MKDYYTLLILALFSILFGVFAVFAGWKRMTQGAISLTWPTTDGEITYSQIERTIAPERRGTERVQFRYHTQIRYEYTVDNATYEGHQLAFADPPGGKNDRGEQEARAALDRYPLLEPVPVYYDPDDPATAVLEPGISFGSITPFLAGLIMLPGGLFLLFVAHRRRTH